MNFLVLLTFTFCAIINGDDENEKYIDLLPDADKQAFLDQVARRLIKEVTYKNVDNNGSREISNAELDQQNDFVNKVLDEESHNHRRQKGQENGKKLEQDNVKNKEEHKNENSYLDLTLRTGDLQSKKGSINSEHKMEIPVKAVYDSSDSIKNYRNTNSKSVASDTSDDNDIQARGIRRNRKKHVNNLTQPKIHESDSMKEVTKHIILKHDTAADEAYSSIMPQNLQSNSDANSILIDSDTMTDDDDDTSSDEIIDYTEEKRSSTVLDIITEKTVAFVSQATVNMNRTTRNTHDHDAQINNTRQQQNQIMEKHKEILKNASNESVQLLNKTKAVNFENVITPSSLDKPGTRIREQGDYHSTESTTLHNTKSISQNTSIESTTVTVSTPNIVLENSAEHIVNKSILFSNTDNKLARNFSDPIENAFGNKNISVRQEKEFLHGPTNDNIINVSVLTKPAATTKLPYFRNFATGDLPVTTKVTHNSKISVVKEEAVFDKLVNVLREGLNSDLENEEYRDSKGFKIHEQHKIPLTYKEYSVYEISAERTAFQKQTGKILHKHSDEQPYYAPVYNYEPENAYFNAYNRLGPNDDNDEDSIFVQNQHNNEETSSDKTSEKSYLRKFKFNKKSSVSNIKPVLKTNNYASKFSVVKPPKYSNINPNDYLDLDYFFGRMGKSQYKKDSKFRQNKESYLRSLIPDTDDEGHPINTMKNYKAKSYLSDIRQLLFKNKRYGHIADTTTKKSKTYKNRSIFLNKTVPGKKLRYLPIPRDDISMDYLNDDRNSLLVGKNRNKYFNLGENQSFSPKCENRLKICRNNDIIENNRANTGTLMELLKIDDPADFLKNLDTMLSLNIPLERNRKSSKELEPFLRVLRDMIHIDNEALVQFDWLGTAVEINSAIKKLSMVTETLRMKRKIHTADLNLLKYVQYLYFTSKQAFEKKEIVKEERTKQKKTLPINNRKEKLNFLKARGLIDRVWSYLKGRIQDIKSDEIYMVQKLDDIQRFLNDVRNHLFNLHNSLKQIAESTSYKKQTWYDKLKDGYLKNATKNKLLEVLLHIKCTRLFDLIENRARNGLEDDLTNEEDNQDVVQETLKEFVFVLKVLDEIKRVKE